MHAGRFLHQLGGERLVARLAYDQIIILEANYFVPGQRCSAPASPQLEIETRIYDVHFRVDRYQFFPPVAEHLTFDDPGRVFYDMFGRQVTERGDVFLIASSTGMPPVLNAGQAAGLSCSA